MFKKKHVRKACELKSVLMCVSKGVFSKECVCEMMCKKSGFIEDVFDLNVHLKKCVWFKSLNLKTVNLKRVFL